MESKSLRAAEKTFVFVRTKKSDKAPKGKVVPEEAVGDVVQAIHETLGHADSLQTWKELEKHHIWIPEMRERHILKDSEVCD